MKFNKILIVLFVFVTGHVKSMEKIENARSCLIFELNKKYLITGYFAQDMKFYTTPDNFFQKNVFDVVPLDNSDKDALKAGFEKSFTERKIVVVPYSLQNERFLAEITVLTKKNSKYRYLVAVTKNQ